MPDNMTTSVFLRADCILGVLGIAFGATIVALSFQFPMVQGFRLGAGFVPGVVATGIMVLSLVIFLKGWLRGSEAAEGVKFLAPTAVCAGLLALGLIPSTGGGLVLASLVCVLATAWAGGARASEAVVLAIVLTVGAVVLFGYVLPLNIRILPWAI